MSKQRCFLTDGIGNNWGTKYILPTEVFEFLPVTLHITTSDIDVRIYSDGYFDVTVFDPSTVAVSLSPVNMASNDDKMVCILFIKYLKQNSFVQMNVLNVSFY